MIEFDPEKHIYRVDGRIVRSVTAILGEWVVFNGYYVNVYQPKLVIAESVMKEASDHGTAVHEGANLLLTQGLDWDALHPSLVHPLKEFEKWRTGWKPQLVSTGYPMYSKKLGYAGTPDPFYVIRTGTGTREVLCFVEIKTGGHLLAGPQLAAYVQMFREHAKYRGPIQRWVLELPKKGKHKFDRCENPRDMQFFESCLFKKAYVDKVMNVSAS